MTKGFAVLAVVLALVTQGITALPQAASWHWFRPRLLWNASASAPRGLYWLSNAAPLTRRELVAVIPPTTLAAFMAERGYLALHVPLLKAVAALPQQRVCRIMDTILVDGHVAAVARDRDHDGRALPRWRGCVTLRPGTVFLLNAASDSFDGRYFGVTRTDSISARATPLWLMER